MLENNVKSIKGIEGSVDINQLSFYKKPYDVYDENENIVKRNHAGSLEKKNNH